MLASGLGCARQLVSAFLQKISRGDQNVLHAQPPRGGRDGAVMFTSSAANAATANSSSGCCQPRADSGEAEVAPGQSCDVFMADSPYHSTVHLPNAQMTCLSMAPRESQPTAGGSCREERVRRLQTPGTRSGMFCGTTRTPLKPAGCWARLDGGTVPVVETEALGAALLNTREIMRRLLQINGQREAAKTWWQSELPDKPTLAGAYRSGQVAAQSAARRASRRTGLGEAVCSA